MDDYDAGYDHGYRDATHGTDGYKPFGSAEYKRGYEEGYDAGRDDFLQTAHLRITS